MDTVSTHRHSEVLTSSYLTTGISPRRSSKRVKFSCIDGSPHGSAYQGMACHVLGYTTYPFRVQGCCITALAIALESPRLSHHLLSLSREVSGACTALNTQENVSSPSYEGGEALQLVAQRSYGCPIPGNVQGQDGWGFELHALVSLPMERGLELETRVCCFPLDQHASSPLRGTLMVHKSLSSLLAIGKLLV